MGYVGEALDLVRDGLSPFITETVQKRRASLWRSDIQGLFKSIIDPDNPPWDSYYTLKAITHLWHPVFQSCLPRRTQNYAYELSNTRNDYEAHRIAGTSLTEEEAHRALDTATLMLNAIKAGPQLEEAIKLRAEVRAIFSKRAAESGPVFLHEIQNSKEPEFTDFLSLMKKEFPDPDVRDPDEDLTMWLDERDVFDGRATPCEDVFLVAKESVHNLVVALLYASKFPSLGFLFISYIAVDRELVRSLRESGNVLLARAITENAAKLLLTSVPEGAWTKGMVTEIARDEKNAELKRLFFNYAKGIFGARIYEIGIEYIQPALDPDGFKDVAQDLLYMPCPEHQKIINANGGGVPRDIATDILRMVYYEVYAGNFDTTPDGPCYRAHVEEIFDLVTADLPEVVPLLPIR